MNRLLVLLSLVCLSLTARAQGVPELADIRKLTDVVMTKVGSGDLEGGLKAFRHLTVIPAPEFDSMVGQAALQAPLMASRFGQVIGHEFIGEDRIGESLARLNYIQRFEKHAMRWTFYLYRGKSGWVINTFRFDDKWPEMF